MPNGSSLLLGLYGIVVDSVGVDDDCVRRAAERLTDAQHARLVVALAAADPAGNILAAWIAKGLLHDVLACGTTGGLCVDVNAALWRFYDFCAATAVPEIPGQDHRNLAAANDSRDHHRAAQCPQCGL